MAFPRLDVRTRRSADGLAEPEKLGIADNGRTPPTTTNRRLTPIIAAGLLFELLLILSFVPAPLVPLTVDSGMDEVLPWLQVLGYPIHAQLARLTRWIDFTALAIWLQMACFLALYAPYAAALRSARHRGDIEAGRALLCFGVLFELTALCSRRLFSTDLFSYVLNGRIIAVHGANPYLDVPAQFPEDPYLPLVDWREVPSFYGPLWTLISAGLSWLGGEQLGVTLLLFRLVPAAAAICASFLIWRLLRRSRPHEAALGVALWSWNPLVILESAGSGHNDALLAFLLVVAVAGVVYRRAILGLTALVAAALVKYSALVLGPLYFLLLLRRATDRRERRSVLLGLVAGALLTAICFVPFWSTGTLSATTLVSSPARYANSPAEVLYSLSRGWFGEDYRLVVARLEFRPWWAAPRTSTELLLHRGEIPIARIEENQAVLAINRSDGTWQRIYDPVTRETGYVPLSVLRSSRRPAAAVDDPEIAEYERAPTAAGISNGVNLAIRGFGWAVFLVVLLALMRSVRRPEDLLSGWLLLLTLVYWLVATWFFPWYLIWGLAIAALRPRGALVWALVVWSAAVLLYYGIVPLEGNPAAGWVYRWRVIPMFLPPLLVLTWYFLVRRRRAWRPVLSASGAA